MIYLGNNNLNNNEIQKQTCLTIRLDEDDMNVYTIKK